MNFSESSFQRGKVVTGIPVSGLSIGGDDDNFRSPIDKSSLERGTERVSVGNTQELRVFHSRISSVEVIQKDVLLSVIGVIPTPHGLIPNGRIFFVGLARLSASRWALVYNDFSLPHSRGRDIICETINEPGVPGADSRVS